MIDVSEGPGDLDPLRGIEEKNGQQYVGEIKMNRWILEYQRPHPERRSGLGGSQGYSRTQCTVAKFGLSPYYLDILNILFSD